MFGYLWIIVLFILLLFWIILSIKDFYTNLKKHNFKTIDYNELDISTRSLFFSFLIFIIILFMASFYFWLYH